MVRKKEEANPLCVWDRGHCLARKKWPGNRKDFVVVEREGDTECAMPCALIACA